jgi:hypothetical protein
MSISLAERERLKAEFTRLNSKAMAAALRTKVEAVQARTGLSFDAAWTQVMRGQENPPPEPTTLGEAAKLIKAQNPTWTFEKSWNQAKALRPDLVESSTAEENRIEAKLAPGRELEKCKTQARVEAEARQLMSREPRLTFGEALRRARGDVVVNGSTLLEQETAKHKKLEQAKKAGVVRDHVAMLARIREMMTKNPSLTWDQCFTAICREESEAKATARHAGSLFLVTAHSVALSGDVPREIMYMPAGRTVLTPSVNGAPRTISVNVTRSTADLLQSDLEKLLKQNVPPIICFDHSETRAAALPKRFTWKEGQGVFLTVDWTSSGQAAVAGHDYGWLSPTFMLSEDGALAGLPQSGGSIGSLTNRPAFTSIARIATA